MGCNDWIRRCVKGKTFADVGGLWGTVNEKITVAAKAGAAETTMIDIAPLDHELWQQFYERCSQEGVVHGRSITANVDDPVFAEKTGLYDVVHCSGVVYHCPNPLYTVSQLAKIAKFVLILASAVIPFTVSNKFGTITTEDNSALFVPALNEHQKKIVARYFEEVGGRMVGINLPLEGDWSLNDYAAWWYLFTPNYVAGLLGVCGFRVVDTAEEWAGRTAYFLAQRNQAIQA
jgi:hypothetical protein